MVGKYFFLAFVCFSLAQVQGNEVQNAIKKGLTKTEALYNRGIQRIDSVDRYQSQLIETKATAFIQRIQRLQEATRQSLRRAAQIAEEKANEMEKPESVFECISKAEKNANTEIEAFTTKFGALMERLQKMYSSRVQIASRPLATYRQELRSRYERTAAQIKACKTTQCVEIAVNNFAIYLENVFEAVKRVQTQISTIVNNFQREARTGFNNVNRQVGGVQSNGFRQIRECVYRRDAFQIEQ